MSTKRVFLGRKENFNGSFASAVKCLSAKKERQKDLAVSLWSDNFSSSSLQPTIGRIEFDESIDSCGSMECPTTPVAMFQALNELPAMSSLSPLEVKSNIDALQEPRLSAEKENSRKNIFPCSNQTSFRDDDDEDQDKSSPVAMFQAIDFPLRSLDERSNSPCKRSISETKSGLSPKSPRRKSESSDEEEDNFDRFLAKMKDDSDGEEAEEDEEHVLSLSNFIVPDEDIEDEASCTASDGEITIEDEIELDSSDEENDGQVDEDDDEEKEEVEEKRSTSKIHYDSKLGNTLRDLQQIRRQVMDIFTDDEDDEGEREEDVRELWKTRNPIQLESPRMKVNRSEPKTSSDFLMSLSDVENAAHNSSFKYIRNFKTFRMELTEKLYKIFNEEVFESKLPSDMIVEWSNRLTTTAGQCRYSRSRQSDQERHAKIRLSTKVCSSAERVRDTLAHEMCHAATWLISCCREAHGQVWKGWACRVMRRFPALPPVSTTHNYVVFTKYTYKCTACGASINRHSRSINTEEMVCSLCFGTFELVVNRKGSSQTATANEAGESRRLNPFAKFVKEHYAATKRDAGSHAEAMRQLSKMFSALKTLTTNDQGNS